MSVVKRYTAYVNSSQRIRGTPDEFTVGINPPYVLTNSRNFFRVTLVNACIPFSFPQVNSVNNGFVILVNGTPYTVSISTGNYNILTLLDEVKTQVLAQLAALSITAAFTTAYSSTSGKVSWTLTSVSPATTIAFVSGSTVAKMMGLTTTTTFTTGVASTFQIHVDVNPLRSLYVRSDNLTQRENMENILEKSVVSDVLAEVPILVNPGAYIILQTPTIPVRITNKVIDSIEMYLSSTDDYRLTGLDLDWTANLEIVEVQHETFETDIALTSIQAPPDTEARVAELEKEKEKVVEELKAEKERLKEKLKEASTVHS